MPGAGAGPVAYVTSSYVNTTSKTKYIEWGRQYYHLLTKIYIYIYIGILKLQMILEVHNYDCPDTLQHPCPLQFLGAGVRVPTLPLYIPGVLFVSVHP